MTEFPRKPAMGDPCNGCGLCCVASACGVALEFVPTAELGQPCPALEWEDGRSWCGMVRRPNFYSPLIAIVVGAGEMTAEEIGERVADDLCGGEGWGPCDSGPMRGETRTDPADGKTALEYAHMIALGIAR